MAIKGLLESFIPRAPNEASEIRENDAARASAVDAPLDVSDVAPKLAPRLDATPLAPVLMTPETSAQNRAAYDHIIVGGGYRGEAQAIAMAERGHRVLLVEAGSAEREFISAVPAFHLIASGSAATAKVDYVNHFSARADGEKDINASTDPARAGQQVYPRTAGGIGGNARVNAMVGTLPYTGAPVSTELWASKRKEYVALQTAGDAVKTQAWVEKNAAHLGFYDMVGILKGDPDLNAATMQTIHRDQENNQAHPLLRAAHRVGQRIGFESLQNLGGFGFDGPFAISSADPTLVLKDGQILKLVTAAFLHAWDAQQEREHGATLRHLKDQALALLRLYDPDHVKDGATLEGFKLLPEMIDKHTGTRSGLTDKLVDTQQRFPGNLTIMHNHEAVRLVVDDQQQITHLELKDRLAPHAPAQRVAVKIGDGRGVTVNAGPTESMKLFSRSGIGNRADLERAGIPVTVAVERAGAHLMDRTEFTQIYEMPEAFASLEGAKLGQGPNDPHMADFLTRGAGLYATNAIVPTTLFKPDASDPKATVACFTFPGGSFVGYHDWAGWFGDRLNPAQQREFAAAMQKAGLPLGQLARVPETLRVIEASLREVAPALWNDSPDQTRDAIAAEMWKQSQVQPGQGFVIQALGNRRLATVVHLKFYNNNTSGTIKPISKNGDVATDFHAESKAMVQDYQAIAKSVENKRAEFARYVPGAKEIWPGADVVGDALVEKIKYNHYGHHRDNVMAGAVDANGRVLGVQGLYSMDMPLLPGPFPARAWAGLGQYYGEKRAAEIGTPVGETVGVALSHEGAPKERQVRALFNLALNVFNGDKDGAPKADEGALGWGKYLYTLANGRELLGRIEGRRPALESLIARLGVRPLSIDAQAEALIPPGSRDFYRATKYLQAKLVDRSSDDISEVALPSSTVEIAAPKSRIAHAAPRGFAQVWRPPTGVAASGEIKIVLASADTTGRQLTFAADKMSRAGDTVLVVDAASTGYSRGEDSTDAQTALVVSALAQVERMRRGNGSRISVWSESNGAGAALRAVDLAKHGGATQAREMMPSVAVSVHVLPEAMTPRASRKTFADLEAASSNPKRRAEDKQLLVTTEAQIRKRRA